MGWHSYKLGDILKRRKTVEKILPDKEYKLVTIKLYHKGVILRHIAMGSQIKSSMSSVRAGDFILSGIDARNGAFGIVPEELDGAIITNDFWCLEPDTSKINADFFLYLTSTSFFDAICKESSDGTTQRIRLQKDRFFNYRVKLPSIEEQKNILSKLRRSGAISEALSSELNHQTKLIIKLRQSILEEAMQGKLVKQNSKDEHAGILLEKIKKKKLELITNSKVKSEIESQKIKTEDIAFELPKGWIWCRLGDLGSTMIGLTYSPSDISDNGIPVLRSNNIKRGKLDLTDLVRVRKEIKQNIILENGDILICARNGSKALVGKAATINDLQEKMTFGAFMAVFRSTLNPYIEIFLNSPVFRNFLEGTSTTTINQITQQNLKNTLIPLAPLSEQIRIVSKVKELIRLCDNLEQEVNNSKNQMDKIIENVLREAFSEN